MRPEYRYSPNGQLSLEIVSWRPHGTMRIWSDTKRRPLEDRLGGFLVRLVELAAALRKNRLEREEEERKRQAWEERRWKKIQEIRAEEQRVETLHARTDAWHKSRRVRAYVAAVREAHPEGSRDEWIAWALRQADRLDPLTPSPPSILDERRKWESYW